MHLVECSTRWDLVEYDEYPSYWFIFYCLTTLFRTFARIRTASDAGESPKQSCQAIKDEPITWILVIFYMYAYIYSIDRSVS